jgi:hypothetical protein
MRKDQQLPGDFNMISMAIFHGKLLEYKGLASKQWHLETSSG